MVASGGVEAESTQRSECDSPSARRLRFYKLDGAGNDFVGIDWRGNALPSEGDTTRIARALCDRHHGIGADGLLLVCDADPGADFRMIYFNADGSRGEMCGNGARCIVALAQHVGAAGTRCRFQTDAGLYSAERSGDEILVDFPDVGERVRTVALEGPAQAGREVDFLTVGVPHAIVFSADLDMEKVAEVGREIRFDPAFPRGTNVNFVDWDGEILRVRTYERGVEGETQACGTGSVASACAIYERECWSGAREVRILPTGGIPLLVGLKRAGDSYENIRLGGPAIIVFGGECSIETDGRIGL